MTETPQFNKMQTLKRRFFAMRNGLLADQLRRAGSKFRIIFGLNIIQLNDIARDYGHDPELAEALWANTTTRESLLLAPMLWQPDDLCLDRLMLMCNDVTEPEIADMVCHKLIKPRTDIMDIIGTLSASDLPMMRYMALRLTLPLIGSKISPADAAATADREIAAAHPLTLSLATMVKSEADFLLEEA